MAYKKRILERKILFAAQHFKAVLVVGARQVGKSTLLKNLFPHLPVVTFNPVQDVQRARTEPELFLKSFTGPVILDEIQFAPELLAHIKIKIDQSEEKGQYLLTGSQNLSMLKTVAESMAGRVAIIELDPMTLNELHDIDTKHWIEHYLEGPQSLLRSRTELVPHTNVPEAVWRGGFPGLIAMPTEGFETYFEGYLKTYIDRDIRTMGGIEQLVKFEHFLGILAALSSQEINYNELGREIDAAGKTAQRWLSLLYASYIWHDTRPFVGNTIKRVSQRSKGHLIDTGFACQLLHLKAPNQFLSFPNAGALFETYVSNMLRATLASLSFAVAIYHWRSSGGAEVDLVLQQGNALYPIEIKMKSSVGKYEARGISAFRETYKNGPLTVETGIIVYAGSSCYWVSHDVLAVPWNMIL